MKTVEPFTKRKERAVAKLLKAAHRHSLVSKKLISKAKSILKKSNEELLH